MKTLASGANDTSGADNGTGISVNIVTVSLETVVKQLISEEVTEPTATSASKADTAMEVAPIKVVSL